MRIKKLFLSIYISLSIAISITLFCVTVLGAIMFDRFADAIAKIAQNIINNNGNYVEYEDIINTCKTALLAGLFFIFVIAVIKTYVTSFVVKYYSMSYAEFYTARYRFLGWIFAEIFTFNVVIDIICAFIALLIKNKEDVKTEKELASEALDLKMNTYGGGKISGAELTVSTDSWNMPKADWAKNIFKDDSEDLRKAQDLYNNGSISKKQYNKIVKDIKRKK